MSEAQSVADAQVDVGSVTFEGTRHPVREGQSVLDALLESGVDVPYSCRKGTCFSCLMTCLEGAVSDEARAGLRPAQVRRGLFLACRQRPLGEFEVAPAGDSALDTRVVVSRKTLLSPDVCRLHLRPGVPFTYRAGQYVNLRRGDGLARSYSLASVPELDTALEIHVKRLPGGSFSNWVFDWLDVGASLDIRGPYGECCYDRESVDRPILLIGTGTGLAPLIGVVRDALHSGHRGEIRLYHGSRTIDGLYHGDVLRALERVNGNFRYHPCMSGSAGPADMRKQRADLAAFEDVPVLSGWIVYACGYPAMVESARKTAYLCGAGLKDIHADAFALRDLRGEPRPGAQPDRPDGW